jgi:hypothetical protein
VHAIGDHYPNDAQKISDPEWVRLGLSRGWSLLTQDERMATQPAVCALLRQYRGSIHCLANQELPVRQRAEWFHSRQRAINQHVRDRRVGFFMVGESGRLRRKRSC